MAATYAGVTFEEIVDDRDGWMPYWQQDNRVVEIEVPGGAFAYTVGTGKGNAQIEVKAKITDEADLLTLTAAISAVTARTLALHGANWTNTKLKSVTDVERPDSIIPSGWWVATLTFVRER